MGYESRRHLGAEELTPLEARLKNLENYLMFVNDKIDFVMGVATAQVMPAGSSLALEPPKPITMPLAELYVKVRKENLGLNRADAIEQSPQDPASAPESAD